MALFFPSFALLLTSLLLSSSYSPASADLSRVFYETQKEDCSVSLLIVGDWGRKGKYAQSTVADTMGRVGEGLQIDFVISTGDNFYPRGLGNVDDSAFDQSFKDIYIHPALSGKKWYAVLGNHDYLGDPDAQLDSKLLQRDPRWICKRSFVLSPSIAGHAEFFFVDTTPLTDSFWSFFNFIRWRYNRTGMGSKRRYIKTQLQDLDDALRQSYAPWKFVIGHHPVRSFGKHGDTKELVDQLLPILERHGVTAYINGHDHSLQDVKNGNNNGQAMRLLTSGGGSKMDKGFYRESGADEPTFFLDGQGFLSMRVEEKKVIIWFFDLNGDIIHALEFTK